MVKLVNHCWNTASPIATNPHIRSPFFYL